MDDDWGLLAVVRGCCSSSANTSSRMTTIVPPPPAAAATLDGRNSFSGFGSFEIKEELGMDDLLDYFPDPFDVKRTSATDELEQLCQPFLPSNFQQQQQQYEQDLLLAISPVPVSPPYPILNPQVQLQLQVQQQQQQQQQQPQHQRFQYQPSPSRVNASLSVRQKKRKNQPKKTICEVTPDKLLADNWAWRKYGQKPIKGSPHPRGYYRCSSFKGCPARKQVERSRNNPENFILTYTAEHNHAAPTHRNSLAGVSRNKSTSIKKANSDGGGDVDGDKNGMNLSSCSYSSPSSAFSPTTTLTDENESKHQIGGVDDLGLDELFLGLEEFIEPMRPTSDVVANDGLLCDDGMLTTHWFGSSSTTPGADGGKI